MQPGELYFLGLALVAGPSMLVLGNRMAAVVIGTWLLGQFAVMSGMDPIPLDLMSDTIGVYVAFLVAWFWPSKPAAFITAMYPLLIAISCAQWVGALHPFYGWWAQFWVALAQIIAIPFCNDWSRLAAMASKGSIWAKGRRRI